MKTVPEKFTKSGWNLTLLERRGAIALFERTRCPDDTQKHWEVVRIRHHEGYEIAGKKIEEGEHYPGSESWGRDGFTYRDRYDAAAKLAAWAQEVPV